MWKGKRSAQSRKVCSKIFGRRILTTNEQLFLPSITMMTLKHRETPGQRRCHGYHRYYGDMHDVVKGTRIRSLFSNNANQCKQDIENHGNCFYDNSLNYGISDRNHGNRNNMVCSESYKPSSERDIVVKYRLEKEKDKNLDDILSTKEKIPHLRTISRQRAKLASREANNSLVRQGVAIATPPVETKPPKEERESHGFRPASIHQRYKSLLSDSKCCKSVEMTGTGPTLPDGKPSKRYVHVYLCCCED